MIALALALGLVIGMTVGLLGGGGSILTLPILTYVVGMEPKQAIAASLFVVGITASTGAITHALGGRIRWRTGVVFGAAGMVGSFSGGRTAAYIPANALIITFATMMAVTAIAMLRGRRDRDAPIRESLPFAKVTLLGVGVGFCTGLVGAGGGFIVVPALVLLGGMAMELAIGTALVVIAMNTFAGLAGHLGHVSLDWPITLGVTGVAVVGSFIGSALSARISPQRLRRGFGVFVLVMAAIMLADQLGVF